MPHPRDTSQRHEAPAPRKRLPATFTRTPRRKSVRCGAGDGPARPNTPAPKEYGQQAPAARCNDERSGEGECPTADSPHRGTTLPRPGVLLRAQQLTTPDRKSLRCGVSDGSPNSPRPAPEERGQRSPAARPRLGGWGWVSSQLRTPLTVAGGALLPAQQRTMQARQSLLCGIGDAPPGPHPPRP